MKNKLTARKAKGLFGLTSIETVWTILTSMAANAVGTVLA